MALNHQEQLTNRVVQGELYQSLNVSLKVFMKSQETYAQDPAKNQELAHQVQLLRVKLQPKPKELTRDECLEGQKMAEKMKLEINKKMFEISQEKKHP